MRKYRAFREQIEIDNEHIIIIEITGNYYAPRTQLPNTLPYDPSRYMHRHRGAGKK